MSDICAMCGRPAACTHHLVFGRGLRELADADKLTLRLCHGCHNMAASKVSQIHENPAAERLSKMLGEAFWIINNGISEHDREQLIQEFLDRYGINYL